MTRTYLTEFPDYDDSIALPDGWIDVSWHNDTCPAFHNTTKGATLYLDYKDPSLRENMPVLRFGAYSVDSDGARTDAWEIEGDDLADVLARIDAHIA